MQLHFNYTFEKLRITFCKRYMVVQTYEHVYMVYKMIKQAIDEKVKVYYGCIFKLANCLRHKVDDSLFTIFFKFNLLLYMIIAIVGMKTCTPCFNMRKLLLHVRKTWVMLMIIKICQNLLGNWKKHLSQRRHTPFVIIVTNQVIPRRDVIGIWKPQQVEGEKMVPMNAIFAWQTKGTRNQSNKLGNQNQANKGGTVV